MKLGVMGYSTGAFNKADAIEIIFDYIHFLKKENEELIIVSGLTRIGVPALAYEIALIHQLKTVGIACSKARDYPCFPCDEVIIVGDKWGDESETFVDYCDTFLRVGGGKQSKAEVELAKSKLKEVLEYDL